MENNSNSKLNIIHVVIIIVSVLLIFILGVKIFQKKMTQKIIDNSQDLPSINAMVTSRSGGLSYANDADLGVSYVYPNSWGTATTSLNNPQTPFEYKISFSNADIQIVGLSYPYSSSGRDGYSADLTESAVSGEACEPHASEPIVSKNGEVGVYTQAKIVTGLGDCSEYSEMYYAVFDSINKKVSNIVIYADPKKTPKETFLNFVESMEF